MASFWLTLPPFHFLIPGLKSFQWFPPAWMAAAGFILTLAAFRVEQNGKLWNDIPSREAKAWLFLILCLGAVLRLWRFWEPHPTLGYDPFWEIMEARNTVELGRYDLILPMGSREPLFHYVLASLWWLFPEASPFVVSRAGSLLLDLAAVWVFYLLGREVAGRRVGLVAAALGAVSKPMVIMTLACTRGIAVTAAAGLVMLFTLRVFKRPDLKHFLQWGAVLGAAAYTYTGVRVLLAWAVLSVLAAFWAGWIRKSQTPPVNFLLAQRLAVPTLVLAGGGWFVLEFIKKNAYISFQHPALNFLGQPVFLAALLAVAVTAWFALEFKQTTHCATGLKNWFPAMLAACLLALPLVLKPGFSHHVSECSVFKNRSPGEAWAFLPVKIQELFSTLFLGGGNAHDRGDMNILGDSYLDVLSIPAVLLGMSFLLARCKPQRAWLFLAALAGILPQVFSDDPHSVKLLSGLPGFFVLAALALEHMWGRLRTLWPGRFAGTAAAALAWLLVLACAAVVNDRIWGAFAKQADPNITTARCVLRESADKRIYIATVADYFLNHQLSIHLDGRNIYRLRDKNPVYLKPGETVPAVVLFYPKDNEYPEAEIMREKISRVFPGAPSTAIPEIGWGRSLWRMELPPEAIEKVGNGLFLVQKADSASWKRSFISYPYGLARGSVVWLEESVKLPHAPAPQEPENQSCRIRGSITVPWDGKVLFSVSSKSYLRLIIDGRTVLKNQPALWRKEPPAISRGTVRLKAGVHAAEIRVYRREEEMPVVQVTLPGEKTPKNLGDF
jgi:hypothetical protein